MNFLKELSNKTVSISEFNRGLAGRIFDDVKLNGSKVVLKNNTSECILISPDDYTKLINELEDARDLIIADKRISSMEKSDLVSQEEFEKSFNVDLDSVHPVDESEIEWVINYLLLNYIDLTFPITKNKNAKLNNISPLFMQKANYSNLALISYP